MNAKDFTDSLFKGYEETAALADFKEELLANLNAKIENLVKKGMDAQTAFEKACAELGDVSALADELSLKKRKEVFEEVYMDIRNFMNAKRVTGYVIFGILAVFGIISALIVFLSAQGIYAVIGFSAGFELTGAFATMLPFLTAAVAGFTWLGMTQETSSAYPVNKKRALLYAAGAGLIVFGLLLMPVVYLGAKTGESGFELLSAITLLVPFVLPGIGLLVFLGLTEKDRLKPWAKDRRDKAVKKEMEMWSDPATASRFGMFSGAIWIFAIGFFILLGFLIGFKFSWLTFIFAVAVQLLVQGMMSSKKTR
ncbi:MAG: permease prefix domain 1-containing protein [Firmicutes bacterium]|nr:permease prefix domain 1-containing protein [Bacillota bacterium]